MQVRQQRMYFVGETGFLQELCSSDGDQWHPGTLQQILKVKPLPGSSIAAVHWYDPDEGGSCIRIFYQDADGPLVQSLIKEIRWNNTDKWHMGQSLVYALPRCGLAAVTYPCDKQQRIHLFYQSAELTLSELYYGGDTWVTGAKNMGISGDSTPITAFNFFDGENQIIQVYWRNKEFDAEIVGASKYGYPELPEWEWKPIADPIIGGLSFNDQFAIAQWGNSRHMRFYYTGTNEKIPQTLLELCNDGAAWVPGAKFGDD